MIRGAFAHFPGLGPKRVQALRDAGLLTWDDLRARADELPLASAGRKRLLAALAECEAAEASQDWRFLAEHLVYAERWRLLATAWEEASFFDLETAGELAWQEVTTIACLHRGAVRLFTRGENLDDFLALLDDVRLLVSFNGASFDVPLVLRAFRIPALPCAHLDLRWMLRAAGFRGGLKAIERALGIERPPDLEGVDGLEAIRLWERWTCSRDRAALERLRRYCGADSVSLRLVAARLLRLHGAAPICPTEVAHWALLPAPEPGQSAAPSCLDQPARWQNPLPQPDFVQGALRARFRSHAQRFRAR